MHEQTETTTARTTRTWMGMIDGLPVIENRRLEDHNNIVVGDTGTPWDYVPRPPFLFQMFHQDADPAKSTWVVCQTLPEAVNEFARWALPAREGYGAGIVDESFRHVLGVSWHTWVGQYGTTAFEMGGVWFGCSAVFAEMRRQCVCDEVSIAMWEVTAMRTAPGSGMVE
jgi:hypothetical protein